jgi:hypothetical protein
MDSPYLVQRAKFQDKPNGKGVDAILQFDYMGSSEFEFGALGNSLRAIRPEIDEYDYYPLEIEGKSFTVFCKEADKEEVFNKVLGLAQAKCRLKEYCDLHNYVKNDSQRNDHWWDIGNHWMVWKENETFTEKFKKAIQPY